MNEVEAAYEHFVELFAIPEMVICDGGPEFNTITGYKNVSPANHPQANSVLERMHLELAKMCRIHDCPPPRAVSFLRTKRSKILFFSALKDRFNEPEICAFNYKTRVFHVGDFGWRYVLRRSRRKNEPTYTGPHCVLIRHGQFTYKIPSHVGRN